MKYKKDKKKATVKDSISNLDPPVETSTMETATPSDNKPQRPKSSPYKSPLTPLRIGRERTVYYVPQDLLQNVEPIRSSHSPWGHDIELPDLDNGTGHTLIHYLYTGSYQTLDDAEASEKEVHVESRRAILVRFAAHKYGLWGLAELAEQKMEEFNAEINIFDIIDTLKDHFSKLPISEIWFQDYIFEKAKVAFEDDHTVFKRMDLLGGIDDIAFTRLLAKCIIELYESKVSSMLHKGVPPNPGTAEQVLSNSIDVPVEEPVVKDCFAVQAVPPDNYPATHEPTADEPATAPGPERTNDWGISWSTNEMTKKKKKKKKSVTIEDFPAPPEPEAEPVPVAVEPEPAKDDDGWAGWGSNSLKKKKKKGKVSVIDEQPAPSPPEPEPEMELAPTLVEAVAVETEPVKEDDPWSFSFGAQSSTKKKAKKKSKVAIEENPLLPSLLPELVSVEFVPEPEPVLIDVEPVKAASWGLLPSSVGKKKKKSEKEVTVGDTPAPLPLNLYRVPPPLEARSEAILTPFTLEPVKEVDSRFFSASSVAKQKAKKKKAIIEHTPPPELTPEPSCPVEPEPSPVEPSPEIQKGEEAPVVVDSFAGPSPSPAKKKMVKRFLGKRLETSLKPNKAEEEVVSQIAQNDAEIAEATPIQVQDETGYEKEEGDSPRSLKADPRICPLRAEHVLHGDQWKTCGKCRAFLQQLIMELGCAGSPDEGAFEMVERVVSN